MEGTTFNIIMGLVSTFSKDPTTLRQEMPVLPPIPQQQIVDYLDLKDSNYQTLWAEAQEHWGKNPTKTPEIPTSDEPIINPNSMLGYLVNYTKPSLDSFEKTLEKKVNETIDEVVDETDRATIVQFINVGQYVWGRIGPWVKLRLIDGALFSYIDQQQYLKAAEFSYMNMSYHEQALRYHRDLLWLAPQKYSDRSKDVIIKTKEAEERKKFWQWHERYAMTTRVNHVLHHLNNLFHFYNNLFQKANDIKLLSQAYRFLTSRTIIDDAICELKASHHNHIAEGRNKNAFAAMMEHGMNQVGNWFWNKGYFRTPRPFADVLEFCESLVKQHYEQMKIYQIYSSVSPGDEEETFLRGEESSSIEKILPAYIEAVEEDNFYEAKKYCTWYLTEDSSFNWFREYQDFENYYQELQKIFYYQDIFSKAVTHVYHLLDEMTDEKDRDRYLQLINIIRIAKEEIYLLHHQRCELKKSFINYIETKSNFADKGLWERVSNSLSRKAIRYFKDGHVFHSITPYEDQLRQHYNHIEQSAQRLESIKCITRKCFPGNSYFKTLNSDGDQVNFLFSPCLLTLDHFIQYFRGINPQDLRYIRILKDNAEKNDYFHIGDVWYDLKGILNVYENLLSKMTLAYEKATKVSGDFSRFNIQVAKLISGDLPEHQQTRRLLEQFNQMILQLVEKIDETKKNLIKCFNYTMDSIFNKYTPIDSSRILGSASRKVVRVITSGQITNPKKLLNENRNEYLQHLEKWNETIRTSKIKLDKMIKLLLPSNKYLTSSSSHTNVLIIEDYVPRVSVLSKSHNDNLS